MGLRSWLLSQTYEKRMAGLERSGLADMRSRLLAQARGRVLEIGAGAGANLRHYPPTVDHLTLTDPSPVMVGLLQRATAGVHQLPTILLASADALPFDDASFDTVVSTLVLCGVPDQSRAIHEVLRVLKPGGSLLLIEHVRAADPRVAAQQDRLNRFNRIFTGCDCNRSTQAALQQGGFDVSSLRAGELPGAPELVRPIIFDRAVRTSTDLNRTLG